MATDAVPAFLRLAGHPLRWRLLRALAAGDQRVRELVALVGEPQNLVSYHLRLLRDAGLVSATRSSHDGRDTYYHLHLDRCAAGLGAAGTALHPGLAPSGAAPSGAAPSRPSAGGLSVGGPGVGGPGVGGPGVGGPGVGGPGVGGASVDGASVDGASGRGARGRGARVGVLFVCTGNSSRSPMAEALFRWRAGGGVDVVSAGTSPRDRVHGTAVRVMRESFAIDIGDRRPRHVETVADRRFDHVVSLCDRAREACPDFPGQPRRVHWSIPEPGDLAAFRRTATEIDMRVRYLLKEVRP